MHAWTHTGALFLLGAAAAAAPAVVLKEWNFAGGDAQGWDARGNHVRDVRVAGGALQGCITDWDPFLVGPRFEIPASPYQAIEVRLKTDCGGQAEFFWTNTTNTPYGGFSPGKETPFSVRGDGRWHEYRVFPFWQNENKIILLRLDFPRPPDAEKGRKTFAVEWVRIVQLPAAEVSAAPPAWDFSQGPGGWEALGAESAAVADGAWVVRAPPTETVLLRGPIAPFRADTAGDWVVLEMAVDRGRRATLAWASERAGGRSQETVDIKADGRFHVYNILAGGAKGWSGDILALELTPSDAPGAVVRLRRLCLSADPQGPPQIDIENAGPDAAICRPGRPFPFTVRVQNRGGEVSRGLRVASLALPEGARVQETEGWDRFPEIDAMEAGALTFRVVADRPVAGSFSVRLAGPGAPEDPFTGPLTVHPRLNLPGAAYVPEPQPVESDYEIGALYFPGWPTMDRWAPIRSVAPERKPVLGWYDEGNPECVDWQIKWAVENGIRFFLVDWYWDRGGMHLDHWVKAFQKARYKPFLKWAMMWANHNPPGSHSEEDQRKVTQFWIDHYFGTPEYYRIEDMPVVMIWSPAGMNRDMAGKGGVARLLEISREMARAAGYKGIWFIAMKWPEASTEARDIQWLADAGFNMTSIYHYMHHGGKAADPRSFPFELVAESSLPYWRARHSTDILPFLPNLSTGWDDRPWHGTRGTVIHGRTVAQFRRICEDARQFADETGIRRLVLAPLNEWGEGSYAEPCREFGFGMYEAVRDVFCRKPAAGWPLNYAPEDVGLGPYDLPHTETLAVEQWDFANSTQGWYAMMGVRDLEGGGGALSLVTTTRDPAIVTPLGNLRARRYASVLVRARVERTDGDPGSLQLFWATQTHPIDEGGSVSLPLIADGDFHDYLLPVAEKPRWRGQLTSFRLDPGSLPGLRVTIQRIALIKAAP